MKDVNEVNLVGNLAVDPITRVGGNNLEICELKVCTKSSWFDRNAGQTRSRTDTHKVACFGSMARYASTMRKGQRVYVNAHITYSSFVDNNQQNRRSESIIANSVMAGEMRRGRNAATMQTDDGYAEGMSQLGMDGGYQGQPMPNNGQMPGNPNGGFDQPMPNNGQWQGNPNAGYQGQQMPNNGQMPGNPNGGFAQPMPNNGQMPGNPNGGFAQPTPNNGQWQGNPNVGYQGQPMPNNGQMPGNPNGAFGQPMPNNGGFAQPMPNNGQWQGNPNVGHQGQPMPNNNAGVNGGGGRNGVPTRNNNTRPSFDSKPFSTSR